MSDLPAYADRPGEQVFGPPYCAENARLHLLFVDADPDKVDDLLDASLNQVGGGRIGGGAPFYATGQRLLIMLAEIEKMHSQADGYLAHVKDPRKRNDVRGAQARLTDADWVSEVELGFWVPVSRIVYGRRSPGFYLPFVFNDSPASVVTGREVYGYPKQLATFADSTGARIEPGTAPLGTVEVSAFHRPSANDHKYTSSLLVTITLDHQRRPLGGSTSGVDAHGSPLWKFAVKAALEQTSKPRPRLRFAAPTPTGWWRPTWSVP